MNGLDSHVLFKSLNDTNVSKPQYKEYVAMEVWGRNVMCLLQGYSKPVLIFIVDMPGMNLFSKT